jgi:8-oxo-dGTP pyrophosphatase MutT (NUDIX family)
LPTLAGSRADVPDGRPAAVAAIFREGAECAEVLLIRRADREGDPWSGHMAFPGGRYEPTDRDLHRTAIRETSEEIGLDLDADANLLGILDDQDATGRKSRAPMPIRPYVFELHRSAEMNPNEEVTEVIWAPIGPLVRGERKSSIEVDYDNVRYTLPAFDIDGRIVWGLTYRMLQALFSLFETKAPSAGAEAEAEAENRKSGSREGES